MISAPYCTTRREPTRVIWMARALMGKGEKRGGVDRGK
jgi:hypothetical protein